MNESGSPKYPLDSDRAEPVRRALLEAIPVVSNFQYIELSAIADHPKSGCYSRADHHTEHGVELYAAEASSVVACGFLYGVDSSHLVRRSGFFSSGIYIYDTV